MARPFKSYLTDNNITFLLVLSLAFQLFSLPLIDNRGFSMLFVFLALLAMLLRRA